MSTRMLTLIALCCALLSPAVADASDEDVRQTVEAMLAGFEKPADDAAWVTFGDQAVPHLLAIAGDEGRPRSTRMRAVAAMGNFDRPEVRAHLRDVLTAGDAPLQRKALRSLAMIAGADELPLLASFLDVDDTTLREAAAHALGTVGTAEARAALEARRARETSTAVLKAIDEELAR